MMHVNNNSETIYLGYLL